MKKTTIDASLLPNMWLTWDTAKSVFYLNCTTGKKQIEHPQFIRERQYDGKNRCIKSGSKPRLAYAKYHEDIEMLELAEVTIDTTRKEEIKQWKYAGEKYFLKKDKTVLDENGNVKTSNFTLSQYHCSNDFKGFLGMFYRIEYYSNVKEFKKFLGSDTYTVGSGRLVNVAYAWHIQEWYKTKQKVRGAGKQQKLTDKLVAMPLSDTSDFAERYPAQKISNGRYYELIDGIIYFERLIDGWSVLRVFGRSGDTMYECERMYLHDDGANRIVTPSQSGWVPAKQSHSWYRYRFVNKNEAMQNCKRLKYIIPLVAEEPAYKIKSCLMNILRFPELEQMSSLGYANIARKTASSSTPKADLKHTFGEYYNEKEKTILRKAGLTKHQFDRHMKLLERSSYGAQDVLKEMRRFFGDELIHLDNTSFDKYYDAFMAIRANYWRGIYPQVDSMGIDRKRFIKNAVRLGEKNRDVYRILNDTLNQYIGLNANTHPEINWYFDTYSDVVRAHDSIDELKRAQDAERRALWDLAAAERLKKEEEKRIKLDKERKKYEYEDDTYIIRLPDDANEIVREGSMQRICIGGYTSRHALGQTNLFFIRKKSEPTVPFYAIEMNNCQQIVQIHGYCNAWLGRHPEVIPTVVRWLRKNGIKCDQKILTCTANGYGATNNYVPMPVVD